MHQISFGRSRAEWYAAAIDCRAVPARPAHIATDIKTSRFDVDNYVVIAPFSAWSDRDWPSSHWSRLVDLLDEAGYHIVALGARQQAAQLDSTLCRTSAFWAIDHPPEWVMDTMLGAAAVVGNDSGMVHIAGMLGINAVAIHSHLPHDFLYSYAPSVHSVTPATNCTFCRWRFDRGYSGACDTHCSALATVAPEAVLEAVLRVAHGPSSSTIRNDLRPTPAPIKS